MFCKNCGQKLVENAAFCMHCGVAAGTGRAYCGNCGQPATPDAQTCIRCGCVLNGTPGQGTYTQQQTYPAYPAQKSRIAAGILAILLGSFGIHNFYLGYTSRGLAQILITVCTCGIGAFATEIWAIVEGVMLLCGSTTVDAQGVPLKD